MKEKMKNYYINYDFGYDYAALVCAASYINPINNLDEIIRDFRMHSISKSYILFDFLLSNGNNFNRFAKAYYDGITINIETISIISIRDMQELKQIDDYYYKHGIELENGVLSSSEETKYKII